MLGKEIYFCDLKDGTVKKGVVLSESISQSGYEVSTILSDGHKHMIEKALIFDNEEGAKEKLAPSMDTKKIMERIEKECCDNMNVLRVQVIGEPEHKELADAIFKG